jgi:hypothetical protein
MASVDKKVHKLRKTLRTAAPLPSGRQLPPILTHNSRKSNSVNLSALPGSSLTCVMRKEVRGVAILDQPLNTMLSS